MTKYLFNTVFLVSVLMIQGCTAISYKAEAPSEIYGLEKVMVQGGDFVITTYQKITNPAQPYVFYIEGDGFAFVNSYTISNNPTPRNKMLLKLASMDQRPNVAYVSRPCQFTPMSLNPKCNPEYWTSKRLSNDSIKSLNDVINKINNEKDFSLVGFSGGGGVAILIAAINPKVRDIITIAGNIDIVEFTNYHHVIPMHDSLNPVNYIDKIKNIPQLHLSGEKDTVVPPFIAKEFTKKADSLCVKQKTIPSTSHTKGWETIWKNIYTEPLSCQ